VDEWAEETGVSEMVEVKVYGSEPPCAKCKKAEEAARKAAGRFPGLVTVEHASALSPEAFKLGIIVTPAIVVNGRIVAQGKVPGEADFENYYEKELGGRS
jgi:protein-disulfide isomerase